MNIFLLWQTALTIAIEIHCVLFPVKNKFSVRNSGCHNISSAALLSLLS
jgi:hypothetical protein